MDEGFDILNAWILAENKVVTYKLLSRLLSCHVNLAKQILEAWRRKNPNSHATYVLCALSTSHASQDEQMSGQQSSMATDKNDDRSTQNLKIVPRSSRTHNVVLVAEADLEATKAKYHDITSCHVYSVEPARLSDYGIVADVRNDVREAMRGRSTKIIDLANTYGTTFNARVHIADDKRATKVAQVPEIKPIMKVEPLPEASARPQPISRESSSVSQSKQNSEKTSAVPKLKRSAASSLASAFAKTQKPKPKVKALVETSEVTSSLPTGKITEDPKVESRADKIDAKPTIQMKKKMEEEAALRDMMMMDDEDEEKNKTAAISVAETAEEIAEADMLDASDWSASDTEMKEPIAVPAPVVVQERIKKRTRKKVKKQVHTKDAKGYMVTKEEWEWISCDEEEVAPINTLSRQGSIKSDVTKSAAPIKKKAPGQAGIASYFSKR